MKTKLTLLLAVLVSFNAQSADDLTAVLQQGLFNEEADHDLAAAIKAYQFVVTGADAQRKLAATAVFRLGECYRKLGQTNEAVAQYQRIVDQFTDQTNLVTLSRQNLVGLGVGKTSVARSSEATSIGLLEAQLATTQADAAQANALVQQLKALSDSELRRVLPTLAPDQLLNKLLENMAQTVASATEQSVNLAPDHPQLKEKRDKIAALHTQIDGRIAGIREGLRLKAEVLNRQVGELKRELANLTASRVAPDGRATPTPAQVEGHRLLIERLELDVNTTETRLAQQKDLIRQNLASRSSDQEIEVRLLDLRRQLILAKDAGPTGTADGTAAADAPLQNFSPAARSQLKELLQGEIAVASQLLADQRKRVQVGSIPTEETWRFERDVLGLNRQLLAVDGLTSAGDRKRWRDMLIEEIALAEKAVQNERAKLEAGKSIASELAKLQRDVFALKRELVTFDAAPVQSASAIMTREAAATDEEDREVRRIQALIKDSPDLVNAKSVEVGKSGESVKYGTPLHKAALQGQLVVARFLIDNNGDLDSRDGFGRTPLHWAALNGHKSMAELLLARGADPNASISVGLSSAGLTPLHFAAQNGYRNVCEALLSGKADLNARTYSVHETPLHLAAARGFTSVAELLLARGADVNARNASGLTPLASAASGGMKNAVQMLLANKADINAQDDQGETSLFAAVTGKRGDVVRLLVAGKANPNLALNEKSKNPGWTPLVAAINQDDVPVARLLLENGANPNVLLYRNGWTALMQAVHKGALELAEALIAAGADVNAKDNGDMRATALYIVTANNPTNTAAIVELLLKNKAEVNAADANGSTPLTQAVAKRNLDVVKLLVEYGADVNAMTRQGESPLSLIKSRRRQGLGGLPFSAQPPAAHNVFVAGAPGQPAQSVPDPTREIISLLEQRGARDDLQRLTAISTSRNQENRRGWFVKGTNDWNHYTLIELMAFVHFRRSSGEPADTFYLAFPDLTRVAISRIDPGTAKTEDIRLDLATALVNGDCAKDVPLQWGDVVDIPEQDHFVDTYWERLPDDFYKGFQKCLERTVRVTIKGQTTNVVLAPFRFTAQRTSNGPWESRMGSFRLNRFLRASGLLLSSSDVTRVKVKRIDPATKQVRERAFNLDLLQNQRQNTNDDANDLWLRDGDVIEVPEKDGNRASAPPRAAVSAEALSVQLN